MDVTLPPSLQFIAKNKISFENVNISFLDDLSNEISQNQLKYNLDMIGPFLFFTKNTIINSSNSMSFKMLSNNFPSFVIFIPNFIIKNSTRLSLSQKGNNDSKNNFSVTLQTNVNLFSSLTIPLSPSFNKSSRQKISIDSYTYFSDEINIEFNSSELLNTFITSFSSFAFNFHSAIMNCPERELCKMGNVNCLGIINQNINNGRRCSCIYINENFKITKAKSCNLVLVRLIDSYSIQLHGTIVTNNNKSSNNSNNDNEDKNEAIACLLDLTVSPSTTVLTFNQGQFDSPQNKTNQTERSNSNVGHIRSSSSFFNQFEVKFLDHFKKRPELSCVFAISDVACGIEVIFWCEKACDALSWVAVIYAWIVRASAARESSKQNSNSPLKSPINSPIMSPRRKSDFGGINKCIKFKFSSDSDESEESSELIKPLKKASSFVQKKIVLNRVIRRSPQKKFLLKIDISSDSDEYDYYSDDYESNDSECTDKNTSLNINKTNSEADINNDQKTANNKNIRNVHSDFDANLYKNNSNFIIETISNHYKLKNMENKKQESGFHDDSKNVTNKPNNKAKLISQNSSDLRNVSESSNHQRINTKQSIDDKHRNVIINNDDEKQTKDSSKKVADTKKTVSFSNDLKQESILLNKSSNKLNDSNKSKDIKKPKNSSNKKDGSMQSIDSNKSGELMKSINKLEKIDQNESENTGIIIKSNNSSNQASEALSSSNQASEALSSSNQVSEALSSSNQASEALSSSNQASEALNSSNQVSEALSSSNQVSEALSSSNQTSEALNSSNQTSKALSSSNQASDHKNQVKVISNKNAVDSPIKSNIDNQSNFSPTRHTNSVAIQQFHSSPIFNSNSEENSPKEKSLLESSFSLDAFDLSFHSFQKNKNDENQQKGQVSLDLFFPYLDEKSDEEMNSESTEDFQFNSNESLDNQLFKARNFIKNSQCSSFSSSTSPTSKANILMKPTIIENFIQQNVVNSTIQTLINSFTVNPNISTTIVKVDEDDEDNSYVNLFEKFDERTMEEVISSSLQKLENSRFNISEFVKINDFYFFDFNQLEKATEMKRPIVLEYAYSIQQIVSLASNEHLSIVKRIGVSINEFINKYSKHENKIHSITVTESTESLRLCFLISALFLNGLKGFNSFGNENEFLTALEALVVHVNSLKEIYEIVASEKTVLTQICKFVILLLNTQSLNLVLEAILDNENWISDFYSNTSYLNDEETIKQISICHSVIQYMNFNINENTNFIVNVSHEDKLKFVFKPAYSFLEIDSIEICQNKDLLRSSIVNFFLKELIDGSDGKGWQFISLLVDSNHVKMNCEMKLFRESVLNAKKNITASINDEKKLRAVLFDGLKYGLLHIWFIIMFTDQELASQFFNKDSFLVDLYRANHILNVFADLINDNLLY